MRGNAEAHQTRFYVCFALAIAATIGVAFAGNLLTLFLFYEALTLVTYPLVTHHGDEEARRGGRTYLALLLATSIVFLLPAHRGDMVRSAGTLDFTPGGILAGKAVRRGAGGAARALRVRHRQGGADAVPPLAAGGDGRAHAGVGAAARGGGGQGRRVLRSSRSSSTSSASTLRRRRLRLAAVGRGLHDPRRLGRRAARRQPQAPARLLDGEPALLRGARRGAAHAAVGHRRGAAHRRARVRQDHAVLRRRRHLHGGAQDRGEPARRHRPAHAVDLGRVRASARCR